MVAQALPFEPFQGEEHQSFILPGGNRAAVLVHGFPGTPAEMRPLAEAINRAGWTASAILLPGFGANISDLPETSRQQWVNALHASIEEMRSHHTLVAVVGFSMGAAVAMTVAVDTPIDGLALIAPFRRMSFGGAFRDQAVSVLWPVLKLIFREPKPFQNADLDDPQIQHGIKNFMPEADLSDPAVREGIRNFSIDPNILEQLQKIGTDASKAASHLDVPMLVVQGLDDEVARPLYTRQFLKRMNGRAEYLELPGDHEIIKENSPSFQEMSQAITGFLGRIAAEAHH